ncbi:leukocyte cell-derived chemotaxin 1-like [Sebastes fasciatus]|uniref:leukocyte cell-derived chemotaxin 1-like n=1 Tax=Sebastes fasciatus TaxID=394691 RepID=UPI003D9DD0DD
MSKNLLPDNLILQSEAAVLVGGIIEDIMRETNMEKIQNTTHGSGCFEHCTPPEQPTSAGLSRLLRFGAVALIVGAVLMLCASMAALYLWKVSDKNVYNVRYSMNINGEVRPGAVEIDSDNNLERFKTGSGAEEAVEIHDFQIGITGIRFFGGGKCYIKSQIKASLPHMGVHKKESLMFDLTDEVIPVRFDEEFLVWVAAEQPLKDTSFLSNKILDLCGELPIYWLQPIYPKDGERRKRDARRAKRQFNMEELEAAAGERNPVSHEEDDTSRVAVEEEEEEGAQSAAGSAYNPENPYHRSGGAGEEGAMTFDTMLDHQGICCSECRRGYTHCQRICEPLRGYWPWPYNHRGCQVACRVIMPCRWWVARILGIV